MVTKKKKIQPRTEQCFLFRPDCFTLWIHLWKNDSKMVKCQTDLEVVSQKLEKKTKNKIQFTNILIHKTFYFISMSINCEKRLPFLYKKKSILLHFLNFNLQNCCGKKKSLCKNKNNAT
jgi:hypothetical protein